MEEIKNEPIKNEPIKVKRPRRTKIQMMIDKKAKTEFLHQKFLEASKETIIPTEYLLLARQPPPKAEKPPKEKKPPSPKAIRKSAPYVKTNDQKESSKRQKNTEYWRTAYGVYIDPTNLEDYYWFKQHACTVRKMLPIMDKVIELKIPYDKRE